MAAERPIPPFLPDTVEDFLENVNDNPNPWVEYLRKAHDFISTTPTTQSQEPELIGQLASQDLCILELKEKVTALTQDNIAKSGIIDFQRNESDRLQEKLRHTEADRDRAVAQAITPVSSTPSFPAPNYIAKATVDPTTRTTPITPPAPSEHSVRSDKLPDPDVFKGDRHDLRRFLSQVSQKLRINYDRYPTPESRLAYVSSRLVGPAYSQILPHINRDGTCRLADYPDILGILERAYGDPNRINNARTELLQLRQKNQEFSTFFAEFQRLALEGELADDAVSTILDNAISRELRGMLMHNPPLSRDLNNFAKHLQDLENRRRQYATSSSLVTTQSPRVTLISRNQISTQQHIPLRAERTSEPMDTSNFRTKTDKERGACYLCHQTGHLARDCSLPNPRNQQGQRRGSNDSQRYRAHNIKPRSLSPPQSPRNRYAALQSVIDRPPTPAYAPSTTFQSENGVGLN
jgi:hypothetical protein